MKDGNFLMILNKKMMYKIIDLFRNIKHFFKNIYLFRKNLWNFRGWDYTYNLDLFRTSLIILRESVLDSNIETSSKVKTVYAMNRAILLLDHFTKDDFLCLAEDLCQKKFDFNKNACHNHDILKEAMLLEEEYRKELWEIIKGNDLLPGSDIRTWWT